jgi:hypothetical protein
LAWCRLVWVLVGLLPVVACTVSGRSADLQGLQAQAEGGTTWEWRRRQGSEARLAFGLHRALAPQGLCMIIALFPKSPTGVRQRGRCMLAAAAYVAGAWGWWKRTLCRVPSRCCIEQQRFELNLVEMQKTRLLGQARTRDLQRVLLTQSPNDHSLARASEAPAKKHPSALDRKPGRTFSAAFSPQIKKQKQNEEF